MPGPRGRLRRIFGKVLGDRLYFAARAAISVRYRRRIHDVQQQLEWLEGLIDEAHTRMEELEPADGADDG